MTSMADPQPYELHTDIKFDSLERIDVQAIRLAVSDGWFNQTLCQVNDSVVRLGVVEGEFHWHKHDQEDEFFYVVSGRLFVDIEDGPSVELLPEQGYSVPRGVVHRTRAPERTAMLMIESAGVNPVGDPVAGGGTKTANP
jgi:mannose-6-phosphate isomerase-like protein (cupin superfamily)